MIGWWVAERAPDTISSLLACARFAVAAAASRAAGERLFGSRITFPLVFFGLGWNWTWPGTLAGASGSYASRRSFHTAGPRLAPRRRVSDERNSAFGACWPP